MARNCVIGLDFGTDSARAVLAAVDTGEILAAAVHPYSNGVIDAELPGEGGHLEPDSALQDPRDYIEAIERTVPQVLEEAGVSGEAVIGIGSAFTACTCLPIDRDGTPLCMKPEFASEPHAWVKLWKHHAAQPEAGRISAVAAERQEPFLQTYGGKISSEWLFPKMLQVLNDAPEVYKAADRFIEAGDWITLQLCGEEKRNACAAGYKALWDERYPSEDFLAAVDVRFRNVVQEKLHPEVYPEGTRAGGLTPEWAERLGLPPGIAVSVSGIDAHIAVPGASVTSPGTMVMIMGTSLCHMVCHDEKLLIPGISGVVRDGILPGYFGYEAGQVAVGDIFAWFVKNCVPASIAQEAEAAGTDVHGKLAEDAAKLEPGESGVLCLDWWNGNRSVLVDAELTGLMVGMTLSTTPAEMYRAVLESTAFGTYKIIQAFLEHGCPVLDLVACGGLPKKNPLLMQIFADVTNREIKIAESEQATALGAAIWGAVAAGAEAGGYANVTDAAARMARLAGTVYKPVPKRHEAYLEIFAEYEQLHDYFGLGGNNVMKRLKAWKRGGGV